MKPIEYFYLFITVVALCFALFLAFVPFNWICKFISTYQSGTCRIRHGVIVCMALGSFLFAILASKQFQFSDTFSMTRKTYS